MKIFIFKTNHLLLQNLHKLSTPMKVLNGLRILNKLPLVSWEFFCRKIYPFESCNFTINRY